MVDVVRIGRAPDCRRTPPVKNTVAPIGGSAEPIVLGRSGSEGEDGKQTDNG
jgi:hypothetical protein